MHPLIDAVELGQRLSEVTLLDLRWSLTDPGYGRKHYRAGHIPDAVFVDLDIDLSAPVGDGRHPLPDPDVFIETLGRLGVGPDDEVVAYDDMAGAVAGRLWWMLRSIGHQRSRLLDGGLHSWIEQGLPLETGDSVLEPVHYPPVGGFIGVVRFDELEDRIVVDVRAPERYRGETEPVDPKAGHIPGAVSIPLRENLNEGRRFLDPVRLERLFSALGESPIVSCGSGVNACHTALAMILAGRKMPDIYIGSFSDWSRRDLPVTEGPEP
jgi:thiosulfate/3-mercaptopyruvate sulfurtransferase